MACAGGFETADGDLVFIAGKGSRFEQAVQAVTSGRNGIEFTHVGIVQRVEDGTFIWEAVPSGGVRRVSLQMFLADAAEIDGRPAAVVMRLKEGAAGPFSDILKRLEDLAGKPYDELFIPGNDAYYCSELLQSVFLDKAGHRIFPSAPMSFNDKETGELSPLWRTYFEQRGAPVPQGVPGTNPGDMSKSPMLYEVYRFF